MDMFGGTIRFKGGYNGRGMINSVIIDALEY